MLRSWNIVFTSVDYTRRLYLNLPSPKCKNTQQNIDHDVKLLIRGNDDFALETIPDLR